MYHVGSVGHDPAAVAAAADKTMVLSQQVHQQYITACSTVLHVV